MQALHLRAQALADVAVQSIADQEHYGVLAEQAARPFAVEFLEADADARAAGPVLDRRGHPVHGDVHVAVAQVAGDVG